jgi:dihydroxyacetone kinase
MWEVPLNSAASKSRLSKANHKHAWMMSLSPSSKTVSLSVSEWVLAFVNGMGGTPLIELYVVANELTKRMFPRKRGMLRWKIRNRYNESVCLQHSNTLNRMH